MKKWLAMMIGFIFLITLNAGCANDQIKVTFDDKVKIGIMLSDVGLGDQSFSDSAFTGLERARDELGIHFDYRELSETKTYEQGLTQLVEEGNDLVVGLGFMVQEDLEKVAKKYPKQRFLLIDAVSELENITSITFKEDEGSYLAGVVAAMTTKTGKIGFVGGADVPLIQKFAKGFEQGAKSLNPAIDVKQVYAGDFGNAELGGKLAREFIAEGRDVLYAAAGFTGVGVLTQAEKSGKLAIGVDSDQYFYAEKAIVTSMLKNIDVALFEVAQQIVKEGILSEKHIELGMKENGVGLAPIRVVKLSGEQEKQLTEMKEKLASGTLKIE